MPPEGLTERTEADEVSVVNRILFRVRNSWHQRGWSDGMDPAILSTLPKSEVARQRCDIFKLQIFSVIIIFTSVVV